MYKYHPCSLQVLGYQVRVLKTSLTGKIDQTTQWWEILIKLVFPVYLVVPYSCLIHCLYVST